MKILHVITTIAKGGAESHLFELAKGQRARGHEVAVAYLRKAPYWQPALEALGISVHPLARRFYGDLRPLLRLKAVIRERRPDVVHAHMPPAELYAAAALLGDATPLITSKHNVARFYPGPFPAAVGRFVGRRSAAFIAISAAVAGYLTGPDLGVPAERVRTIPYGIDLQPYDAVDPARVQALRDSWGVGADTLVIGTAARLVPQKALHILLGAFAQFRAAGTPAARLVIVGAGPLEGELRAQAEALGLHDVVWAGFQTDIPAVMAAFDVFALTSAFEGFGLVLLEAMAAGRPVAASAISAIPEVVADGETGVLVPPGDVAGFAAAFATLADPVRRERFGAAGRARARERFTLEVMVDRTLAVYQAALR